MSELGATGITDKLKADLEQVTGRIDNHYAHFVITRAVNIVRQTDASWTSAWVADRVASGSLWHEPWEKMVTGVPEQLKQVLMR